MPNDQTNFDRNFQAARASIRHLQGRLEQMTNDWPHYKNYLAVHNPEELERIRAVFQEYLTDSRPAAEFMYRDAVPDGAFDGMKEELARSPGRNKQLQHSLELER